MHCCAFNRSSFYWIIFLYNRQRLTTLPTVRRQSYYDVGLCCCLKILSSLFRFKHSYSLYLHHYTCITLFHAVHHKDKSSKQFALELIVVTSLRSSCWRNRKSSIIVIIFLWVPCLLIAESLK